MKEDLGKMGKKVGKYWVKKLDNLLKVLGKDTRLHVL
jgi:hypothetical protein